jgi:hypothetical protein
LFWVVDVVVTTNPSLIVHLHLLTCRRLLFSSAPASCRIASHQPVALPPPPTFTSPVDSWLLCYRVLRRPPGLFHPMVHTVFLSPTPVDCPFTPTPTHGYAFTAHHPDNAPTIVPLTCYRQRRRQRVGRRHRRPSDIDALLPAPHGCTAAAVPTTLHPHSPAEASLPTSRRCPPPTRCALESIGGRPKAASSFI